MVNSRIGFIWLPFAVKLIVFFCGKYIFAVVRTALSKKMLIQLKKIMNRSINALSERHELAVSNIIDPELNLSKDIYMACTILHLQF